MKLINFINREEIKTIILYGLVIISLSLTSLSFAESEIKTSDYSGSVDEQDLSQKASEFLKKT